MAKTVGCSDFEQNCAFRITASDADVDMMIDAATVHARQYHPEFANTEEEFRSAIRSQVKSLMSQAHMDEADMAEILNQA